MNFKHLFGLSCAFGLLAATSVFALPKATEIYPKMGLGYNIGNTMEVPKNQGGATGWGNPFPDASYVKAIKAAGFNTVRIPCAWDTYATNGVIDEAWLADVKKVVDLVVNEGMYAILNSHWDGGWLEDHVFDGAGFDKSGAVTSAAADVAALQTKYWTQIANYFKSYDEHLIFASANEPGVNDPWNGGADNGQWAFDATRMKVLKTFHEACINAVRATGGNNETRTIVVQAPRTEIEKAPLLAADYPSDPAGTGYTMAEVHFYPYQFSLMTGGDEDWGNMFYYWEDKTPGTDAAHTCKNGALGSKTSIDELFGGLKTSFYDKGIPVVVGEMGAVKRLFLEGNNLKSHLEARAAWYGYTVASAKKNGIVPCVWDTGDEGEGNFTIVRRQVNKFGGKVGDITDYETLNAMRKAYGLDTLAGNSINALVGSTSDLGDDRALLVKYTTATDDTAETGTLRFNMNGVNWSQYKGIRFEMKITGESAGPCTNEGNDANGKPYCNGYAWSSIDMFAMSGASWGWNDAHLGETANYEELQTYTVSFDGSEDLDLPIADLSDVKAIGFNLYGTQFTGTLYIDNMVLIGKDGSEKVFQDFNKKSSLVQTEGIASNSYVNHIGTSAIKPVVASTSKMFVNVQQGFVNATFTATEAASASAKLVNSLGQVIASQDFTTRKGSNTVQLKAAAHGPAMLLIKSGSQMQTQKVILK